MKASTLSLTFGAVGVATLFVLSVCVSLYNTRQLYHNAQQVAHTHEVLDALGEFQQQVVEVRTRPWDRTPPVVDRRATVEDVRKQAESLRRLTTDNSEQQGRVGELEAQVPVLAEHLDALVAARKQRGIEAVWELSRSDAHMAVRHKIADIVEAMEKHERRLLVEREAANLRQYSTAMWTGAVAGVTGLGVACLFVWLLERHLRESAQAAVLLESQRQFLQATLAGIGDGVIVTDADCNVTFLNPVAQNLTGWSQVDALGKPIEKVFHIVNESTRKEVACPARRAIDEGRIIGLANHTVLLERSGREFSIDDSASPIRDPSGGISGAVLVFRDISAHRKASAALREAERRKDEFLAMLGHELRNPLAGIVTGVQVLEMLNLGGDAGEMAAIIGRQAAHMSHIVDDLLDVSRIARGKLALRRTTVELGELLDQVVRDYHQSHQIEDCEVVYERPDSEIWVDGDRTRLAQVVTNLLHNGCKFCDGPNVVKVSVETPSADRVNILVDDRGIGMTCETIARIFEPFNQADNSLERSRGGLGLGLALVKGVVELHGGLVSASSDGLGKGTRFTISLPRAAQPELSPQEAPSPDPTVRKVLLIDDRRDAIWPVQKFLEMVGHQVHTASDGPSGLAKAREILPEIVLCDIGLEGEMNGYQVAQALRKSPEYSSIYLVAVTGYGQEEDRRTAQAAGFDYHLTKPVSRDQLQEILKRKPRF